MSKVIYRYLRYAYLRRKLRCYILQEQKKRFDLMMKGEFDAKDNLPVAFFIKFQAKYKLKIGEMGILLREIIWHTPFWGYQNGIVVNWIYPSFDYYSDLEVLRVMLPTSDEILHQLEGKDEMLFPILVERFIQKRLYLFIDS
ncbi:hypothetical protein [Rodentibacter pneumotropicus]|uniref:hypothetical protein n=1 Tax=Rodentibacter pneumotropicus TaxID=758 RepID=UPI0009849892|nr:hypothetical protein [Rodentibacter pneumotropicus]OOF65234.1 hypothetical protein BKL50_00230 [Rodentibacter pneumotropicus]THA18359.1 hypothetical protein D3M83_05840 [Rodentibacter pneumotropicus]